MEVKVSLLIPSRNRPDMLLESVLSFSKKGGIEVLVAIDEDEPQKERYYHLFNKTMFWVKVYELPRYGYENLHEYYNFLAKKAEGKWLMLGNDDAVMETPNWLDIISQYDHTIPQVLNPWSESGDNLFPLISRKWYEVLGHFSRNTHADSWVQQIAQRLNLQVYVPGIKISHLGEDLHDATHNEVKQIVRQTSAAYRGMEKERIDDANKIKEWFNESNNKVPGLQQQ